MSRDGDDWYIPTVVLGGAMITQQSTLIGQVTITTDKLHAVGILQLLIEIRNLRKFQIPSYSELIANNFEIHHC